VLISAGVVLAYILMGGIKATIYNEVLQLAVMLAGLIPLCIRSHFLNTPTLVKPAIASTHLWTTLPFASSRAPMDQLGVIFGLGFVLSFGYWCTDFVLMQRAFTARTENDARQVPLWAGFGKLCFSMIVVLPGLAAGRLFPSLAHSGRFDQALPMLMMRLYGPGMLGLGLTAIVASLMSGLAANISAFAAVVTNDIYRAHLHPKADDIHYLWFGRWTSLLAIGLSAMASYLNFFFHDLMEHVQLIFSVFGAPFWAIFLLGMGSRRTDSRGALLGFFSGAGVALLHVVAQTRGWIHYGSNMNANFHDAIYAFIVALSVGYFSSGRDTRITFDTLVFHWRTALQERSEIKLWLLSLLLVGVTVALNIYWR
jgi:SSS family solute:Na+ symporter